MWKYASILIGIILLSSHVQAQNSLSVGQVNRETYALYQKQQWKQLVLLAKKAIAHDIDFYYLRLRMGIAYYELKNYRKSAVLFKKLHEQNPDDNSLKEYLYFSYLLGGRNMDAVRIQKKLPGSIIEKYRIRKLKFISGVYAETKYEFLDDYAIDSDLVQQQTVRNELYHYSFGVNHKLGNRLALYHAYSWVDVKNTVVSEGISFDEEVIQNQYYLKSHFQLAYGTRLALAAHWVQTEVSGYSHTEQLPNAVVQGPWVKGNGPGEFNNSVQDIKTYTYGVTQNGFIGYLGIDQDLSKWKMHAGLLYSDIDNLHRWQQELTIYYYPKGNVKLYLWAGICNQMEEKGKGDWLNRNYWDCGAGFQFAKNSWVQVGYNVGDMYKQVENEGYSVFNGVNPVKNRIKVSCCQYLFKGKVSLFLLYQNQEEKNIYIENNNTNSQYINVQSITGGIKWNF
ncbi:tetratricopeptide repeat protein [Marinifilum sp. D737]|uniref:tetratricopeptide repeat protein n=1 Tax=Marinifilum sp. D737 TaxID=2969628 RepID=UPI0022729880|nr:hypothetical protein [Marinifilum sp. D737]MCY1635976.1 hypothetical protein [Marinifilum sp. D737]